MSTETLLKFTKEQKDFLKFVYPTLSEHWRNKIKSIYFQTYYTKEQRIDLILLTKRYNDDGNKWTTKIPLNEYL